MFNTVTLTPLMFAASQGNVPAMREAIALGAVIDKKDAEGWTALHWAASTGEVAPVLHLLEAGADAFAEDCDGWTPVMWAAWQGDMDVVRLFAEYIELSEVLKRGTKETGEAWVAIRRAIHTVLNDF